MDKQIKDIEELVFTAAGLREGPGDTVKVAVVDFVDADRDLAPVEPPSFMELALRQSGSYVTAGAVVLAAVLLIWFGRAAGDEGAARAPLRTDAGGLGALPALGEMATALPAHDGTPGGEHNFAHRGEGRTRRISRPCWRVRTQSSQRHLQKLVEFRRRRRRRDPQAMDPSRSEHMKPVPISQYLDHVGRAARSELPEPRREAPVFKPRVFRAVQDCAAPRAGHGARGARGGDRRTARPSRVRNAASAPILKTHGPRLRASSRTRPEPPAVDVEKLVAEAYERGLREGAATARAEDAEILAREQAAMQQRGVESQRRFPGQ